MASMGSLHFFLKKQWPMTNDQRKNHSIFWRICQPYNWASRQASNHWDFPNFDGSCGMWSAHGPWLCLKMWYIYILWSVPKWSSHFAVYLSRHSHKIPGPAHRGPQFLAQIACKGGREGAPPNLRFAARKWALVQWIGLRNILQKTIEFTKVGFPVQ